jgi:alpha-mannosidase
MHFALRVAGGGSKKKDLIEAADHYNFPLDIYSYAGGRPASLSFMRLESGSVAVATVKTPEDNHGRQLVLRVYETDGEDTRAVLRFHRQACGQITAAAWVDSHELPAEGGALFVEGDQLVFELKPFRLAAIRVSFSS